MLTFESFLGQSFDQLSIYARLLAGNRHDGEDLLADALVKAQGRWERIGHMEHPAAYVRTIVTSTHIRRRSAWYRRNVHSVDPSALPQVATSGDTAERVENSQLARAYLSSLSPRQRAGVYLRFYLDQSFDEIGMELGISTGGARALVHRALTGLRQPAADEAAETSSSSAHSSQN